MVHVCLYAWDWLGRALSLILDGMPDMIFVFFMIFEFIAAGITFYLLKQMPS